MKILDRIYLEKSYIVGIGIGFREGFLEPLFDYRNQMFILLPLVIITVGLGIKCSRKDYHESKR